MDVRDFSLGYKFFSHIPLPTRSRGPYVSLLSAKSVPNQAFLMQDKIHKARPRGYKNGVHSQTRTCVHKQPNIALYFESETVLKFYNLEASS